MKHTIYLSAVISYRNFSSLTLEHRLGKCKATHSRLRKVLQGRRGLTLQQCVLLWKSTVLPTALYGLGSCGLQGSQVKRLYQVLLKQLRAVARAPAHLTHEPDEALLDRLRLQGPAETLYRTHVHMLSARDQTDAFLQAATHPWMQALQEAWRSATVEGTDRRPHRPDQPSSSAPAISEVLLTPSDRPIATNATPAQTPTIVSNDTQIATLHSAQTPPSQADHAVMDKSAPAGQYACPHCPKSYALLSTLRWHMTKVHKLRMPAITFDRVPQSVDGMPVCARCGESFTRWEVLEAHVVNQRCSGILPTEATVQGLTLRHWHCRLELGHGQDPWISTALG